MSEREREEAGFGGPDEVGQMLGELRDVDPPADLVGAVMSQISSLAPARAGRVQPVLISGGRVMAKKVLWSVMGAAAAVLIVLKMAGYPPASDGTEGTIGAAQRYQSQQISDADVKVKDAELQKFLQSDAFHRLVSDKAARQALADKNVQKALADSNVRMVLANEQLRMVLVSDQVHLALANEQLRLALANEQIRLALANEQLRLALANEQIRQALTSEALIGLLAAPNFAQMLVADGFQAALVAEGAAAGAVAQ
jgi:hypothetical protein